MLMMRCALVTGVKTCALPISFEFVEQRAENHRPGRTERMAESDRATVDVDFVRVDLQIADRAQDDGGKGLVDLEPIDIRRVHRLGERRVGNMCVSMCRSRWERSP